MEVEREDVDRSPWAELVELLREERSYLLAPLVVGCALCALGVAVVHLAGPLAPLLYPGF